MASHPGRGVASRHRRYRRCLPHHPDHPWQRLGWACLGALAVLCARPARADEAAPAAVWLDTLVVTAPADGPRPAPSLGAVVTRIDLEDAGGARDLADVLGAVAGLQVRRYGAVGASAVPSLRGAAPAQLRLFIDGMPLDDAQTGQVDLGRLPLERFAAVDVHRGGVPVRLGGIGGAGAVNLRTRRAASGLDLGAGAGSFGELHGRALWGAGRADDGASCLVLLHGRRADNDFPFRDHNWTFNDTSDDTLRVRRNAWLREHGMFATARGALGGGVTARGWVGFLRRDGGRPGPVGDQASPHATVRLERRDGYLGLGWRGDLVRLEAAAARGDERLEDPRGEVGWTPPGDTVSRSEDATARLTWSPVLADGPSLGLGLRLGAERRGQWFRQRVVDLEEPLRHRTQTTVFGAAEAALAGGRLLVSPSLRWQENADDFPPLPPLPWLPAAEGAGHLRTDWSPAVGLVWDARPGRLALEAHAARSVRVPTWIELFGHRGGIAGNRELQPERIASWDVGATARPLSGLSLRAAFFVARTEDTIVFVPNSQQTSQARNIGASRNHGLELEAVGALPGGLGLQANATFQRPRDAGDAPYGGKPLPFLPDREAFLRLRRDGAVLAPWVEVLARSSAPRDRYDTPAGRAPARLVLDLGAAWTVLPGAPGADGRLVLAAAVLNLTDAADYDIEGFPLPGRSWRASLQVRP